VQPILVKFTTEAACARSAETPGHRATALHGKQYSAARYCVGDAGGERPLS
jgi:hypothetical protein